MKKIISLILGHKIIALMVLAVIIAGSYFGFKKLNVQDDSVSYTISAVEKGMLISSISGTGQVSASNTVDINPQVSGDIVLLNVKIGDNIKQGDLLAQIDARDAARKIGEAQASLENSKLDLEELMAPTDRLTLIQSEHALADAEDSLIKLKTTQANNYQDAVETKEKAEDNLEKAYEDAYNDISNAFLDLPDVITGLYTVLFSDDISESEISVSLNLNNTALINGIFSSGHGDERVDFEKYVQNAENNYYQSKNSYDANFDVYKDITRYSDKAIIKNLLNQAIETTKKIADTVKNEINMLNYWAEYRVNNNYEVYDKVSDYQSDLSSCTSKINSHLSALLSANSSIEDYNKSILDADRSLKEMEQNNPLELAASERSLVEKKQKLADLQSGATELEIKSKKLAIQQKENSLIEAQQSYADYFIRAPFDGTVAELNLAKGDTVGSGSTIATLITNQKIAEITLNEIDAAKIKVKQKANLTFDAISDLSITGEVVEVDTLGTVNSGVVSYNVKIAFDVQDEKVKPGMSVSVNIIIESKLNILIAPINAVKTMNTGSYVEILVDGQIQRKTVITGLSNDTMVEIADGLEEGEKIITQTVSNGSSNITQTQSSGRTSGSSIGGMMMMR